MIPEPILSVLILYARNKLDREISSILKKINAARDEFRRVKNKIYNQVLDNTLDLLEVKLHGQWLYQESVCTSLRNFGASDQISSIADLNALTYDTYETLTKVRFVETCDVFVTQHGELRMSPSSVETAVDAVGDCVINERNVCRVTVRDPLGLSVVDSDDILYELSATLVDNKSKPIDLIIENKKNGRYDIIYFPVEAVPHKLFVTINGIPLRGAPLTIYVGRRDEMHARIVFGKPGNGEGQFAGPWGVACGSDGSVYIADRRNNRIQVFSETGKFIRKIGEKGDKPGQFNRPCGLTFDSCNRLIVADKDNHRIQILSSDGANICHFGENCLEFPWDVAVDSQNRIAVTEGKKRAVTLFNDSGEKVAEYIFTEEMELQFPRGVASLPGGGFLVTEFNKHKIIRLNMDFQRVECLGSRGDKIDEFFRPQGIDISKNGLMAVSDCRNKRIKIYKGDVLERIITGVNNPQGIAFHPSGFLVCVDSENDQVQYIYINKLTASAIYRDVV